MERSIVDSILREHEIRNETIISYFRFIAISVFFILDVLVFAEVFEAYEVKLSVTTILLDFVFGVYAFTIMLILHKKIYVAYLKYLIVTFDFILIMLFILFDPTIAAMSYAYWLGGLIFLLLYLLNVLRYSKGSTVYAGILVFIALILLIVKFDVKNESNLLPGSMIIGFCLALGYMITTANRNMMVEATTKKVMERYLAPQLVNQLYERKMSLEPGGQSQTVTILFADIRNFTTLCEGLPAQDVVQLLNAYLQSMTDVIYQFEGTIDKFIGDAIMALFGAPITHDDDPARAIKCAIWMMHALEEFNVRQQINPPFRIGIGIHSGDVVVGNIGSEKRLDYTVIGDAVNLTSRIERLTKMYGCPLLISESTYELISQEQQDDAFLMRAIDDVVVKGKTKPVTIYQVMPYRNAQEKETIQRQIALFEHALKEYKAGKFKETLEQFEQLPQEELTRMYKERCHILLTHPPEEWTGVFTIPTK